MICSAGGGVDSHVGWTVGMLVRVLAGSGVRGHISIKFRRCVGSGEVRGISPAVD